MGYCANPKCNTRLLLESSTKSIAHMAHIKPHSQHGADSHENLILLCRNCHKQHEPADYPEAETTLREWKINLPQRNASHFAVKFNTFDDLAEQVRPLFSRNYQIFRNYGPHTNDHDAHKIWKRFEEELIANNAMLQLHLRENIDLFNSSDKNVINSFIIHVDEFTNTRVGFNGMRKKLFPNKILSILNIEEEDISPQRSSTNVYLKDIQCLQSVIKKLKQEERFIDLKIVPDTYLTFTENGEKIVLHIDGDKSILRKMVKKLFPTILVGDEAKTYIELDGLKCILNVLNKNSAKWEFEDLTDLTIITIKERFRIKLFYNYIITDFDLQNTVNLKSVRYVANMYHWNGGKADDDALEYAQGIGVKVMNSTELMRFCANI